MMTMVGGGAKMTVLASDVLLALAGSWRGHARGRVRQCRGQHRGVSKRAGRRVPAGQARAKPQQQRTRRRQARADGNIHGGGPRGVPSSQG